MVVKERKKPKQQQHDTTNVENNTSTSSSSTTTKTTKTTTKQPIKLELVYESPKKWNQYKLGISLFLFFISIGVFMLNGDMTIGGDSTSNVLQTLKLVSPYTQKYPIFTFSPIENPCLFIWKYTPDLNSAPQRGLTLNNWNLTAQVVTKSGERQLKSAWELYEMKRLVFENANYYLVPTTESGLYANTFGIGTSIISAPFFFMYTRLFSPITHPDVCQYNRISYMFISKFSASFYSAVSVVAIFLTSFRILASIEKSQQGRLTSSTIVAILYAFGTSVFSINSQALWQHAPNTMFISLGLYFYVRLFQDHLQKSSSPLDSIGPNTASFLSSCFLCMATFCRPTSALYPISCLVLLGFVFLYRLIVLRGAINWGKWFNVITVYGLTGALFGSLFLLHNYHYFGSPFKTGQTIAAEFISKSKSETPGTWITNFSTGASTLLFSPSRGLFIHSPYLLFIQLGILILLSKTFSILFFKKPIIRQQQNQPQSQPQQRQQQVEDQDSLEYLYPFIISVLILFYAASTFFDYWGGWCFGCRPLTDTMPVLSCLVALTMPMIKQSKAVFFVFLLVGLAAYSYDPMIWNYQKAIKSGKNGTYVPINNEEIIIGEKTIGGIVHLNIDQPEFRHRLWSWPDCQFVFLVENLSLCHRVKKFTINSWLEGRLS
eukprot:gene447-565_t